MRYTRYPTRRSSFLRYFPTGVKWLLLSNIAIFIVTSVLLPPLFVLTLFAVSWAGVFNNFYVWQPFTYMFLHGGIWHLILNMLMLGMFGIQLEQAWGTRQFLKYYFICGVGAGICILLMNVVVGAYTVPTVGSSGAIMGLLVAFGVLYPNGVELEPEIRQFLRYYFICGVGAAACIILVSGAGPTLGGLSITVGFLYLITFGVLYPHGRVVIPIKAKYLVLIYVAIELWASFGATQTSSLAHLGGMLVGYVYLRTGHSLRDVRCLSALESRTDPAGFGR